MLRLLSLSLLFILVLGASGCDSDESLLGEFVGRIDDGVLLRAVEGEAVYTIVETADGPEFVLGLFVGSLYDSDFDEYDYVLLRRSGERPGVGAYAVDDDPNSVPFSATIARVEDADDPLEAVGVALNGTDGTLAITRVDGYGFISGSYRFDAEGLRVEVLDDRLVGQARGTFEARYEPPSTFRRLGLDLGI